MSFIGYILIAFGKVLSLVISIYTFVVAISVLLSWVNPDPYNPLVKIIRQLTEPAFFFVRRFMPRAFFRTGMDFSPIIVLIALILIETIVVNLLFDLGRSLLS